MPPLYESMIPQDRRQAVAALIRAATVSCTARKKFYAYAAEYGMLAACDHLDIQPGTEHAAARDLRAEVLDIAENP